MEKFEEYIEKYLKENVRYVKETKTFMKYLKINNKEHNIFSLQEEDIDNYFEYLFNEKIGAKPTLVTYLSGLKELFIYLIDNEVNFKELYAYIDNGKYKERLSEELVDSIQNPIVSDELLCLVLSKIDKYFDDIFSCMEYDNIEFDEFIKMSISLLFIKLSLLIPIKPNELMRLEIGDILNEDNRIIEYNNIIINIPNNFRKQIINILKYIKKSNNEQYKENDKIMKYLFNIKGTEDAQLDKQASAKIDGCLKFAYRKLELNKMLEINPKKSNKTRCIYTAESYKRKAIVNMLENGVNVLHLIKLTNLKFNALIKDFEKYGQIENQDIINMNINDSINKSTYFKYI